MKSLEKFGAFNNGLSQEEKQLISGGTNGTTVIKRDTLNPIGTSSCTEIKIGNGPHTNNVIGDIKIPKF